MIWKNVLGVPEPPVAVEAKMLSNGETPSAPEGEGEAAWTTIDIQGYEYRM
jgi:hypothetical protein